jgi:uncharacterized RDD family membrane protein YckC
MPADSTLKVRTPEGIEFVLFPAGPLVRGCAYGIDQGIQLSLVLALSIINALLENRGGIWIFLILIFCIDWLYHVICEQLFKGQSPGKRIVGIRVVRNDGGPVNPGASFLRNLLRFADTFLFLFPIAFISMALSKGFKRLGDWTAGTLVVYTAKALAPPRRRFNPPQAAARSMTPPGHLSFEEKQGILMFARRYPLLGKARADEIARAYVDCLFKDGSPESRDSACLLEIARGLSGNPAGNLP